MRRRDKQKQQPGLSTSSLHQLYTRWQRGDDAMMRRYTPQWHRFNQPDPYDGSYSLTEPQSFNRYAYTQNDPVNFVDPTGLNLAAPGGSGGETHCVVVHGLVNDARTLLSAMCMTIGGGFVNDAGGGFGGIYQDPLPTAQPKPHPSPNSQQKQFDDCLAPALNLYRGRLPGAAGKTLAGGAGLGVGIAVLKGAPSVGFGINAAGRTLAPPLTSTKLFHGLAELRHAAWISTPINLLSGGALVKGLEQLIGNRKAFEAAIADCARKWPLASAPSF